MIDLEDLIADGRLVVMSQSLGMGPGDALLILELVWLATQKAQLSVVTEVQFECCVRSRLRAFYPKILPFEVLGAMVSADLARPATELNEVVAGEQVGGFFEIVGNQKQIEALEEYRERQREHGRRGGLKKSENLKNSMISSSEPYKNPSEPYKNPSEPYKNPSEPLAKPSSVSVPVPVPDPNKKKKQDSRASLVADEPSAVAVVGRAFKAEYEKRYNHPLDGWGAKENGQAKNLLKSWPLERVLELIPRYFAWPNKRVIDAGHPFGAGYVNFISTINELKADIIAPERRPVAYSIAKTNNEAYEAQHELGRTQRPQRNLSETTNQLALAEGTNQRRAEKPDERAS
jgi:hypothetical protein